MKGEVAANRKSRLREGRPQKTVGGFIGGMYLAESLIRINLSSRFREHAVTNIFIVPKSLSRRFNLNLDGLIFPLGACP